MGIERWSYRRTALNAAEAVECEYVEALCDQLVAHLERRSDYIDTIHLHGASSALVQSVVAEILSQELGFDDEIAIIEPGLVARPRPDFTLRLPSGHRVLAEVERGGTVTNNHDLKDLWKAHISESVRHLFLIVPNANWRGDGSPREKPFPRVVHRIGAFFRDERSEVDVDSCHVIGYGSTTPVEAIYPSTSIAVSQQVVEELDDRRRESGDLQL